jgi:type VI secretion system ImpM family protein
VPPAAAGFFGKLPCAGDFVQRRLPASFVDAWDRHFETAVAHSRDVLGEAWHEAFHASPVWRFALAPGVCGEAAWAGVMGPGADRVGRCFPMVIAAPLSDVAAAIRDGAGWFKRDEQLHGAAQADAGIGVDDFDAQVAALGGPLDAGQSRPDPWHEVDWTAASHWRLPLPTHGGAMAALADLWTRLSGVPGRWCLWWTDGAGRVPASVLVIDGLPRAEAYAGLLDAGQGAAAWQTLGSFGLAASRAPGVQAMDLPPPVACIDSWLPDDLDLLADLGGSSPAAPTAMPLADVTVAADVAVAADTQIEAIAGLAVLQRPDVGLSLVAAEVGVADPRQQAVAAVAAIAGDMLGAELIGGMQVLRTRIMALNPQLRQFGEDLVDPVPEDCAVIAAHVANGQAALLRIGAAAGWHWRHGRLQPFFARSDAPPASVGGGGDDLDDLLFSPVSLAAPGLGATAQPTCGEVSCALQAGDRLLLMASHPLLQVPPELLARSLAAGTCSEARARIAAAAGLGTDPDRWPLAIIEVHA